MAIQTSKENLTLKIELDGGLVEGKQKIKNKSFNHIKTSAKDEALYNTASIISGLQERDLLFVKKVETSLIIG